MSSYGRNGEFRVQPHQGQRGARFVVDPDVVDPIPFWTPVEVDVDGVDAGERNVLVAAAGDTQPINGLHGIAFHEYAWEAFYGGDPVLQTFSDKDLLPSDGKSVYLVSGDQVEFVLRNTDATSFYGQKNYAARTMIEGLGGATPTVEVGDVLRPHDTPSDTDGYWQEAAGGDDGWLVVTHVDNERKEAQVRFLF